MNARSAMESTVLVIDDDASIRASLKSLFESVGLHVELFESVDRFVEGEPPDVPCCLVLDVRLPGISGLDFQNQLVESGIEIPIVFLTGHGDIPMSVQAMKAGAVEFLTKPCRDQDLLDAVRQSLSRDRTRREAEGHLATVRTNFDTLTIRERQVFELVTTGLLNKQIAGDMGISEVTVKMHRGNLMRKMQAKSLADLIRMADLLGVKRSSE